MLETAQSCKLNISLFDFMLIHNSSRPDTVDPVTKVIFFLSRMFINPTDSSPYCAYCTAFEYLQHYALYVHPEE